MIRSNTVTLNAGTQTDQLLARVAELELALAREERVSDALREVGAAVGSTLDLDRLLELILERIKDLLDVDRSTLFLLDEANRELVSRVVVGGEIRSLRVKVGEGIAGTVARTGKIVRVRDAHRDRRFVRDLDQLIGVRTRSMLAAPLKNHVGKLIGVVQVVNKKAAREFTAQDEALLGALAMQAAISIEHSRLFLSVTQKNMQLLETKEKLEQSVRHLKLLFELESTMNHAATRDDLVRGVLRKAVEVSDSAAGSVLLLDEEAGVLELLVWRRDEPERLQCEAVRAGDLPSAPCAAILSEAMQAGSTVVRALSPTTLIPLGRRRRPLPAVAAPGDEVAAVAVPLEGDEAPIGAMGICSKAGARFGDADLELVKLVAANFSTAVRLFHARMRREREERLSTIGSLLSSVVHDLKSPMAVIQGCVRMMTTAEDPAARKRYGDLVVDQLNLIAGMQREVLEFARGQRHALVRRVYVGTFFDGLAAQLRRELENTPVELSVEIGYRGTARFDEGKVTRVVHNLARNAIEAMGPSGGKLAIRVLRREVREPLVIEVADTGPGIPKEIEARLFQSFVTAKKSGGTGLGLAIVKKIVDEHGGTVAVRSTPRGTTFTIALPQAEAKA